MLVPNQLIEAKWVPASRQWYEDKGYIFTKYRESFYVKAEHLPPSSGKVVDVECDYCGKTIKKKYVLYLRGKRAGLDCCKNCTQKKVNDVIHNKYGVTTYFKTDEFKEKSKQTCMEKYGVEYVGQAQEVKDKIEATNMERYGVKSLFHDINFQKRCADIIREKYGVDCVFQSEEIKDKIKQTIFEKYGYACNVAHIPVIQEKIQQTNLKKYGVLYTTQADEVIKKAKETMYRNGNTPTSTMEMKVCDLLCEIYGEENCTKGAPVGRLNLDCLLNIDGEKIDVEYDGWYWHKNRQEQDKRRNYWLIKQGYKILRIRSNNELPTREQIIQGVDYLVKDNRHLYYIDLDI